MLMWQMQLLAFLTLFFTHLSCFWKINNVSMFFFMFKMFELYKIAYLYE